MVNFSKIIIHFLPKPYINLIETLIFVVLVAVSHIKKKQQHNLIIFINSRDITTVGISLWDTLYIFWR